MGLGVRHWFASLLLALVVHALFLAAVSTRLSPRQAEDAASNIVRLSFGAMKTDVAEAVELEEVEEVVVEEVEVNSDTMIEVVEVNPMIFTEEVTALDVFDQEVTTVELTEVSTKDITPQTEEKDPYAEADSQDPDQLAGNTENNQPSGASSEEAASIKQQYEEKLYQWLAKHKRYPARARRLNIEGTVQLQFLIDRSGNVLKYTILESSGHDMLDQEVEAMIKRANPLPAMPDKLNLQELELEIPISFSLS